MGPLIATEKALSLSKMSLYGKYRLKVDLFFCVLFFFLVLQRSIRHLTEGHLFLEY